MNIGTTEAASLLGVCCQRVRKLLAQGRIQGAEKVGRTWQIPLFNHMPVVIEGTRGPDSKWKKRRQRVATQIHVNRQKLGKNRRNKKQNKPLLPVLTVELGKKKKHGHEVEITGPCKLVYRPYQPLDCGATLWIEVDPTINVITRRYSYFTQEDAIPQAVMPDGTLREGFATFAQPVQIISTVSSP